MKQYYLNAKHIGLILLIISIVLFLVFLSSTIEIMKAENIICKEICGPDMNIECPHAKNIPLQGFVGFSIAFVLAGIAMFMIFSGKKYQEELTEKEKKLEKIIKTLKDDEKTVYETIKNVGGVMFQSELIEKTGFSKVKISRILDRLEVKGLIERRRRGMSNVVILRR
jgi:uncharacterized membrane protein